MTWSNLESDLAELFGDLTPDPLEPTLMLDWSAHHEAIRRPERPRLPCRKRGCTEHRPRGKGHLYCEAHAWGPERQRAATAAWRAATLADPKRAEVYRSNAAARRRASRERAKAGSGCAAEKVPSGTKAGVG